jgi:hypothetical protein
LRFADAAGFRSILQQANAVNFIKPVVTAFLFARLLISPRFVVPQARTLVIGAALAICSIFIPNALLGFTKKYQEWVVLYGSKSHLYTYHSFIAAVVAGALLLAYANAKSRLWRRTSRLAFLSAVMIALIIVSFAVEVRNEYVAFDQKLSRRKWELMDAVIASSEFSAIPNGANVVAPTLGEHYRGIAIVATGYWSKYVWYKTGKSINFLDDRCPKEAPCYLLVFRQKPHADRQFVAFAKATNSEVRSASEVTIYSMPIESGGALVGSLAPSSSPPELKIDGVPISNVNSELGEFSAELPPATDNGPVQIVKLAGNAAIFPEQVNFLEYGIEPHLRPYSAELAEGIDFTKRAYPHFLVRVSGMSGAEQWGRWTDAKLSRTAELEFRYPLPARFELEITAHGFGPNNALPAIVTVGAVTKKFISTPDWRIHHIHFETDGSARTIEITAPKPTSPSETDPRNNDTRQLGIALSSLRVRELRAGQ